MLQVGILLVFAANADAGYTYRVPSTLSKTAPLQLSNLRTPYTKIYSTYPTHNRQQYVTNTVSYITQQHEGTKRGQHQLYLSNNQPAVIQTVPATTQQQQSYNIVNNYQLPSNNPPVVYQTVPAATQQQAYYSVNNYQLPSNNQPAVYQTVSAITQPQQTYSVNDHQLTSNNLPAVYQTVSATKQQQQSYNDNNYQLLNNNLPAVYETVPAITQKQQSYNNVNNYVTAEYGSEDSGNAEHFQSVQIVEKHEDGQVSGIHVNEEYHTEYEPNVSQPAAPVVTKHIYFHVPPADVEEHSVSSPAPSGPPKKIYNILFIKVPAHQTANTVQLQQILANQQNLIEDKTLIYVLVKKPEPQPVPQVPITPVNSPHEVFYVKYKGDGSEAAAQINDQLAHLDGGVIAGAPLHSSQLQPGLVNSHN